MIDQLDKLTDPTGRWSHAVGRLMVSFGLIEHIVHVCLENIPKEKIKKSTLDLSLSKKLEILIEILQHRGTDSAKELSDQLQEVRHMTAVRNLVAHNPLVFSFYRKSNGDVLLENVISSLKNERKINIDGIEKAANHTALLLHTLYLSSFSEINNNENNA